MQGQESARFLHLRNADNCHCLRLFGARNDCGARRFRPHNKSANEGRAMSSKRIVAIFLEDADRAEKLAAELSRAEIDPLISRTADDFHKVLNYQRVDLVVIDNDLPGFLTGLEILE